MAVTHGHGNPNWTRDEVILALELYFDLNGKVPSKADSRVRALSVLLRSFPHHANDARRDSFRNADGVMFKLQNIRQIATGRGLSNVSRVDKEVWKELGQNRAEVNRLADLVRAGIKTVEGVSEGLDDEDVFTEGRVVTETHVRRERDSRLRKRLITKRIKSGNLKCEMCLCGPPSQIPTLRDATFEAHHLLPLSSGEIRRTQLKDMALLCANCHRLLHRTIAVNKRWLTIEEVKAKLQREN